MRCIPTIQLSCIFAVVAFLSLRIPRGLAFTHVARSSTLLVAPASHSSESSLAPGTREGSAVDCEAEHSRHRNAPDFPKHDCLPGPPSRLSQRSLAVDLTASGLRFIFSHFDIIASSAFAYRYTTEFYRNMTIVLTAERRSNPPSQKLVVAYGAMKLTAAYVHRQGFTEETLAMVLLHFADYMLDTLAMILIGSFRVAVWIMEDIRVMIAMDIEGID
ncbi:MAG: hypothetical protein LQ337_002772 [Flavoplaca oasis]|nr:MAG: hypothetical protein LQ337_002772 [Flavoplaca oasis]